MSQTITIQLSTTEKEYLFSIVRQVLLNTVKQIESNLLDLPQAPEGVLHEKLGAFVTYTKNNSLRGCIGYIEPVYPLWKAVAIMSYNAACRDQRFSPISLQELPEVDFEISILGQLSLCPDLEQVEIGKHGLKLEYFNKSSIFLPQVPLEQDWSVQETLEHLCIKAGLPSTTWKELETKVYWYEGIKLIPHNV